MAILNEYLSCLVSSVAEARAGADMRSAQIAEAYYKEDGSLLRHFPVPRMRIGNVSMEVPVAIDFTSDKTVLKDDANMAAATEAVFTAICTKCNIKPSMGTAGGNTVAEKLYRSIKTYIDKLKQDATNSKSPDFLSRTTAEAKEIVGIVNSIPSTTPTRPPVTAAIATEIESTLKTEFLKTMFNQVDVIVESAKLKERDPQTFIKLKIDIVEEGMEWIVSDDGKKRLIPE
jgi:hypothetical protein